MKPSECATALRWMILAGQPVHLSGEPGVGKTSIAYQVTQDIGYDMLETRLGLIESVDLRGLPVMDMKAGVTRWLTPAEFPKKGCKPTVWFFDEWMQGMPSVQSNAGQLLNARRLGDYELPDNVYIMGASNRAKDRAATNRMPSQISSRFCQLTMEPDIGDWTKHALAKKFEWETIGFLRWKDELLSKFDPNAEASPTCRSWEYVSKATKVAKALAAKGNALPPMVEERGYAGLVGNGAAAEYMGFISVFRNLPDPTAMLANPDRCTIPEAPDVLSALSSKLAKMATDNNMDRLVRLANRLPDEFSVLTVTSAVMLNEKLSRTTPYIEWAVKHQAVMN